MALAFSMNRHRMNVANVVFNAGRIAGRPSDDARLREVDLEGSFLPRANARQARNSAGAIAQCEAMLRRAIDCCADTPYRPLRQIRTSAFMAGSRYAQLAGDARADLGLPYAAAALVQNKRPRNEGEESRK
jgi:hypothetical protein